MLHYFVTIFVKGVLRNGEKPCFTIFRPSVMKLQTNTLSICQQLVYVSVISCSLFKTHLQSYFFVLTHNIRLVVTFPH